MKSLILTVFLFWSVLGEIDKWNLVTFSQEPLSTCLEEKLKFKIKCTPLRRAIANHHTKRFQGKTVSDHIVEKESQTDEYFDDKTNKNLHLNPNPSSSLTVHVVSEALFKCSNPVISDSKTRYSLPHFIQEGKVGPLLDDMLVQWPHKLPKMVSSESHLKLLKGFARYSLINYVQACKTTTPISLNELLRFYWNQRAELFFDGWNIDSYIRHVYTSYLPVPHTYNSPRLFYERRFYNFSDRNPAVSKSHLNDLINMYALRPTQPRYNYFLKYQKHGYTASDKLLEDSKIRYYQVILIFMELLETGDQDEMPEVVDRITKDGNEFFKYLAELRSNEMRLAPKDNKYRKGLLVEPDFISMPDLIMLRWSRLQTVTLNSKPLEEGEEMIAGSSKVANKCHQKSAIED